MRELAGANAILTGASRGLGVHIARALADRGTNLALAARSPADLEVVRSEVVGRGVKAVAIPTDVGDPEQRARLVEQAESELGPTDILINNAGIEDVASYHEADPTEIERIVTVNLTAAMLLTRAVLPGMVDRGRGHVVNVASLAGKAGTPFQAAYSASKFGLVGFTRALRAEYVDSPIGFSVICPGFVREDGMYAVYERRGLRAPRTVGTTTPAAVARAVIRALIRDRPEVIVNGVPVRPLLALGAAFPGLEPPLLKRMGVTQMMRRAAEMTARV